MVLPVADASAFNRGVRNELIPDVAQGAELPVLARHVTDGSLKQHPCQKFHQCGGLLLVQVQIAVGHLACLLRLMTKEYDGYTAVGRGVYTSPIVYDTKRVTCRPMLRA